MLCLQTEMTKYSYQKVFVIILLLIVCIGATIKLNAVIITEAMAEPVKGVKIMQVILAFTLLSIGANAFLAKQYYSHHEQIKNHQNLVQELCYQRDFDMLSGLKNRNSFTHFAQQLEETGRGVSIVVCDIDGLKMINDTLGHMVGDTIVRKAAEILNSSLISNAQLFRIGGDEFVIVVTSILPESDLQKVKKLIKVRIASYNVCYPTIPLSMSIGFATTSLDNCQFWSVIKQADYNMYQEKRMCQGKVYGTLRTALGGENLCQNN